MANRKVSELGAADSGNLHDAALVPVTDLTEGALADQNVKATIAQLRTTILNADSVGTDAIQDDAVTAAQLSESAIRDAGGGINSNTIIEQVAGGGGTYTVPAGWWNISGNGTGYVEVRMQGFWLPLNHTDSGYWAVQAYSDGVYLRVRNANVANMATYLTRIY